MESRIASVFAPSPELSAFLSAFVARRDLKAERIRELEARVAEAPADLALREDLTRVYFWNGFKEKAVLQLEAILASLFVASLDESDAQAPELAWTEAQAAALRADASLRLGELEKLAQAAAAKGKSADAARVAAANWEKKRAAWETAMAATPPPKSPPKQPDPAEGERLASARDEAESAFVDAVDALGSAEARLGALVERAAAIRAAFAQSADRERGLDESFRAIVEASGWAWNPAQAAAELALPAHRGEGLAAYGLARVLATAGAGGVKNALAALEGAGAPALAERKRNAEYAIRLRLDYHEARDLARRAADAADAPAGSALEAAARELVVVESASPAEAAVDAPAGTEGAAGTELELVSAKLASAQAALPELRRQGASAQADLVLLSQTAATLRDKRLVRAWRTFEESSAYRRAELGAYYDELGQAEKAAAQYRLVLAVDAANVPAMYQLALAENRSGDWKGAARLFRSVYAADPEYGNAASLYNRIARLSASAFDLDSTFTADLNRLSYKSSAALRLPISSALSLGFTAGLDSVREVAFDLPAYLALRMEASVPITIGSGPSGTFVIRPLASFIGTSAEYAGDGGSTHLPSDFLGSLNLYTAGGAALDFRSGALYGSAFYHYEPLADTLNPARFPLYAHRAELSVGAYLPMHGIFRYFAPRIYGLASSVPADGNFFGTALIEAIPAIRLSDSPWANLGLPLDLVYEDSLTARTSPYYAADQALTAKGGLLWQSSFSGKEGNALSATVQAMGGLYQTGTFSASPDRNLYLQLLGRLAWAVEGLSYWLSFEGSGSGRLDTETFAYWSLSLLAGVSTKQPRLIAP